MTVDGSALLRALLPAWRLRLSPHQATISDSFLRARGPKIIAEFSRMLSSTDPAPGPSIRVDETMIRRFLSALKKDVALRNVLAQGDDQNARVELMHAWRRIEADLSQQNMFKLLTQVSDFIAHLQREPMAQRQVADRVFARLRPAAESLPSLGRI